MRRVGNKFVSDDGTRFSTIEEAQTYAEQQYQTALKMMANDITKYFVEKTFPNDYNPEHLEKVLHAYLNENHAKFEYDLCEATLLSQDRKLNEDEDEEEVDYFDDGIGDDPHQEADFDDGIGDDPHQEAKRRQPRKTS